MVGVAEIEPMSVERSGDTTARIGSVTDAGEITYLTNTYCSTSGGNEKRDRLLFWRFAGSPARAQRGGEAQPGGDVRLPVRSSEWLRAIDAGPKGGQIRL